MDFDLHDLQKCKIFPSNRPQDPSGIPKVGRIPPQLPVPRIRWCSGVLGATLAIAMLRPNLTKRLLPFLLVLAAAFAGLALLLPSGQEGPARELLVQVGEGTSSLSRRLVEQGHLRTWQRPAFILYARFSGMEKRLKPGIFLIPAKASPWRLVHLLETVTPRTLRVTLPEGRTCRDFAGILGRASVADSSKLARLCNDSAFAASLGIPSRSLEGYLFPDTYSFELGMSETEIWKLLHQRFLEVMARIADSTAPIWREGGLPKTVTLASIVEREAAVSSEAPRISGVFWLRLRVGIPLGADPTVRYALGKFTGTLTRSDLALESPYNTRLYAGLPPGPIANPGRKALEAAMHPDTTEGWLYFVAKDDGSREHYFSRSLNEHVRYKNMAARNRRSSGVMVP